MAKKKKPKAFTAVTAVKSMSRTQFGAVPPTRRVENTKKKQLPGRADDRDRAKFAKARTYMIRRDDMMVCKNMRCRKRFEISGLQSVAFLD